MSNFEIYRKTFTFLWQRLFLYLLGIVIMIACTVLGYMIIGEPFIGMGSGFIIGLIIFALILHYCGYLLKAAQIAMMMKGVADNKLPKDVSVKGKELVKKRFATVSVYYAVTNGIKGIFAELTKGLNSLADSSGNSADEGVTGTISAVINIAVAYLCDCCLGWVFYRTEENAFRSTCEGAVLYFKNWKTLIKNMGRVLGFGAVSLVIIGGLLGFGYYSLLGSFPVFVQGIVNVLGSVVENESEITKDPTVSLAVVSFLFALITWSVLHAAFVRPFVLIGVLRNYMKAGIENLPKEADMAALDGVSKKFKKAHVKADTEPTAA